MSGIRQDYLGFGQGRKVPYKPRVSLMGHLAVFIATSWMIVGMSARIGAIVSVPFAQPVRPVLAPYRGYL